MGYAAITTYLRRSNGSAGYKRLEQWTETIETAATPPQDSENEATEERQTRPTFQLDLSSASPAFFYP